MVFGVGPAGTGKTYLAMALAVAALKAEASRGSSSRGPRSKPARRSVFCRAI
jgi:DNA replication protein DnaC